MSRASEAGNSVVNACLQVCAIYRVPCFRMNSLPVMVPRSGGGMRPICVGKWTDADGIEHTSGMADLLAMPRIRIASDCYHSIPLWIECKAGTGKLTEDQLAFRDYVQRASVYWMEVRDSADSLLAWFQANGVSR